LAKKLGQPGANRTAGTIVTTTHPTGELMFLTVIRGDTLQPAIPGAFGLPGETPRQTARGALKTKTGVDLDIDGAREIATNERVEDPRNTQAPDARWVEATVFHVHLDYSQAMRLQLKDAAGPRALKTQWAPVSRVLDSLYANHRDFLEPAKLGLEIEGTY